MITSFFILLAYGFMSAIADVLPVSQGLPTQITTAFQFVVYQINTWSFIFPLSTVFLILSYVLLIEVAYFGFEGALWIYHKVRGI